MQSALDDNQTNYVRGYIKMNIDRILVKRDSFSIFDLFQLLGGFFFGMYIVCFFILKALLDLYTRLKVVSSVFYLSVVQEAKAMKQPINIQIKTELSTRQRLLQPSWKTLFCMRGLESYRLFQIGKNKLSKRLDLAKFLREQKMTNLAMRGLLSQSQHLFC